MKNITLALLALIIACSGCQKNRQTQKDTTTICFAFQDLETEAWVAAHAFIVKSLKANNCQVIERNASQDANKQLEQIRDAIAQKVDGIIVIPQDGESAVTIIGEANAAGIPIGIYNRPPSDSSKSAIVVVANNAYLTEKAVDYMVEEALKRNKKTTPLIMVGDLGDPNAVERRKGFYTAINKHPEIFNKTVEVPTKWDANTALVNLQAGLQANPDVDLLFTSSDFMYPQVRAVLEPLGKWQPRGHQNHVILGGVDGDKSACQLMQDGYVDATGVQDMITEADMLITAILSAIARQEKTPEKWLVDPGFALTQGNMAERHMDMWGCRILAESEKTGK
jgi:ABC-type sugar transport system substrate-binding protein